ncbi:MAG: RNA polymerase sigma factor FliA [Gammaproteobacteria bacterium]|jgi:RNA polymerase sigma factor for flagellar operon FliA
MADLDLYNQVAQNGRDPILAHVGLVKRTALHLKARIPQVMDVDELIQVGMIGLIEASQSFDATRGVDFEIFARTRIRGAILDEVRRISVLPRSAISHIRETNEATQELATELGRAPTQSELADFMGKDAAEYQKERSHAHQMLMVDSEAAEDEMLNTPQSGYEPEQEVGDAMMMDSLSQAIEQLPERDQIIMALYYTEDMNLKEIGAVLDISESRVSQLLSANVKKLRKMMALPER